eukprot:m.265944 g.265944  ORF g.265944 m.265944 type:complete len:55 (-) comp64475_c0_seq1:462-626(-)
MCLVPTNVAWGWHRMSVLEPHDTVSIWTDPSQYTSSIMYKVNSLCIYECECEYR